MKKITLLLLWSSLLLPVAVPASPLEHLQAALVTSDAYQQALVGITASEKGIHVRQSTLRPQLRGSASYSLTRPESQGMGPSPNRLNYGIVGTQKLFDLPSKHSLTAAQLGLELATIRAENVRQQTLLATYRAYLGAALAKENLVLLDQRLELLDEQLRFVTQANKVGTASRLDLINVEAQIAALAAERIAATGQIRNANRQLNTLSGKVVDEVKTLVAPPPMQDELADWLTQADEAPPVKAALTEVSLQEAEIERVRTSILPTVELSARSDLQHTHTVGVDLAIPIFSSGGATAERERQELVRDSLIAAHRQSRTDAKLAITTAFNDMHYQSARNQALAHSVAIAQERLHLTQTSLQLDASVLTDVLSAEADLATARLQLLQARHAQMENWLSLLAATGNLNLAQAAHLELLFN